MAAAYVQDSAKVFDHMVALQGSGDSVASDHLPVFADFAFGGDEDDDGPTTQPAAGLRIASLLPNPQGQDAGHEQVTIANGGAQAADLAGWITAWALERKLGEGGFGEVWLAQNRSTRERRVFKFCFDADRLRSFKRELTLFRLLRDALGERRDIARLYDVKLDRPPFYLESEYAAGGDLREWVEARGGLQKVPLPQRLDVIARVADALHAAHSVGVLHKDVKPSNVLMEAGRGGQGTPLLADFGIGVLTDRGQLARRQITETGFTLITENDSSRTGTRMYSPPELLAGKPFTVQGDVYALGVLLYQMVVGDLERPLTVGWERDVADPLLREDVAACVDGDPGKRVPTAAEVADRVRRLDARREQRRVQQRAALLTQQRARATRVAATAAVASALLLAAFAVAYLRERTLRASIDRSLREEQSLRVRAEAAEAAAQLGLANAAREARRSKASSFIQGHVLRGMSAESGSGRAKPTIRQLVATAAASGDASFAERTDLRASLHHTLGSICLDLGMTAEAESHLRLALSQFERARGGRDPEALESIHQLGRVKQSQGDLVQAELLFGRALSGRREVLGPQHPDTKLSALRLADTMLSGGKPLEAKPLLLETLDTRLQVFEEELAAFNRGTSALAAPLQSFADVGGAAADLYGNTLDGRRRKLGAGHSQTLAATFLLAAVRSCTSRYGEAEQLYRAALEGYRDGPEGPNPVALLVAGELAPLLDFVGRQKEADEVYRQLVGARTAAFGAAHPDTLLARSAELDRLEKLRGPAEVVPRRRDLLRDQEAALGPHHNQVVTSMYALAQQLAADGKLEDASAVVDDAIRRNRESTVEVVQLTSGLRQLAEAVRERQPPAAVVAAAGPHAQPPPTTSPVTRPAADFKATVIAVRGLVQVRAAQDQPWQPCQVGMVLDEGAEFRTAVRSLVRFTVPPGQIFTLDQLGTCTLRRAVTEAGRVSSDAVLTTGRLRYQIEDAGLENRATIRSPNSTLATRG